jgi:hypothetical protein
MGASDDTGIEPRKAAASYTALPPLPTGTDDTDFGQDFALTDAAWNITTLLPDEGDPLVRGEYWVTPSTQRHLVQNGRLMLQVPSVVSSLEAMTHDLSVETDDAIALNFAIDQSTIGGPSAMLMAWGEKLSGVLDYNNLVYIQISHSAPKTWTITASIIDGGVGSSLFSATSSDLLGGCPWQCIALERHGTAFRAWAGRTAQSMQQLCGDFTASLAPDFLSISLSSGLHPNTTYSFYSFLRRENCNF